MNMTPIPSIFSRFDKTRKRLKLALENRHYRAICKEPLDLNEYIIHGNNFSGKKLNIAYLIHVLAPYSINNTLKPLQELGNVVTFELDPDNQRAKWYQKKDARNLEMLEYVETHHTQQPFDVIVCYLSGFSTNPTTLKSLRKLGVPMVNEGLDDERKFVSRIGKDGIYRGNKDICRYFDLSLTSSKSSIIKYLAEGGHPMYKPYAANPDIFRPLPGIKKTIDVVFVGACYGVRADYIEFLRQNGINVCTRGEGWDDGPASTEEMIDLFNRAKIILGFASVGKSDDIFILKGRDFEAPLTGSLYMTQHHQELEEYFRIGTDIETYRDKSELLEKIRYLLKNDDKRISIADSGYKRCLENYTSRVSYEKIFGYLGL